MTGEGMPRFEPLGDLAVRVQFGDTIDPETSGRIRQFCGALERRPIRGVMEWVPAYATVAVYYDPRVVGYGDLCSILAEQAAAAPKDALPPPRVIEIPVRYGGEEGPDLGFVSHYHHLTPEGVVALHTGPTYRVHLLGFMPGFPYLGGLPSELETPRRDTPRARVAAGSVGIAGAQTGVYPFDSPGGWQIIGRTGLRLYDPECHPPARLRAGDFVRFVAEALHDTD